MSNTKWTPGPWRASWDDNGSWYVEPLGLTGPYLRGDSGECQESANAHLIAAAPELYAALEAVEEWWLDQGMKMPQFHGAPACMFMARTALAKARGES